jgi:hypothetical protein
MSWGHDNCAALPKHSPKSASNPCGVKLNSTAASSISAALTAAACAAPNSTVSCKADENAAGVLQIPGECLVNGGFRYVYETTKKYLNY